MVDTNKEKEPVNVGRERVAEELSTLESPRAPQENLEVESWITKIEKKLARIPRGNPGVQDDQVVVQQPMSKQPPVKLPITRQAMTQGAVAPIESALRWLYTFALRQIAMLARLGRRVQLRDIPEVKE